MDKRSCKEACESYPECEGFTLTTVPYAIYSFQQCNLLKSGCIKELRIMPDRIYYEKESCIPTTGRRTGQCLEIRGFDDPEINKEFIELSSGIWTNSLGSRILRRSRDGEYEGGYSKNTIPDEDCYPENRWTIFPEAQFIAGGEDIDLSVSNKSLDDSSHTRSKKCDICSTCFETGMTEEDYCVYYGPEDTLNSRNTDDWNACVKVCQA